MIMPSGTTDLQSFFTGDASFPSEVGFWKSDTVLDHYATGKSAPVSSLENRGAVKCQSPVSFELHQSFLTRDQKLNNGLENHRVAGAEREVRKSPTLCRPVGQDPGKRSSLDVHPPSSYVESGKIDRKTTQFENSLFSRSLSQLFSRKRNLSLNNVLYGHSADTIASHFEEEEPCENLEQIEAQTIGNLLPSDDDLFSGMTDKLDKMQSNGRDDTEELDFFNSVGGLDLEDDGSTAPADLGCSGGLSNCQPGFSNRLIAGEHPCGGQPSRTLFVRNINSNIEDSELRAVFEQFGDIRALYTSCKHRGFVMISYYDIRAANSAKEALQDTPLRRRKLDIHYSIPKENPSENDINQGTLVAFNFDASISNDELHQIFGVYGQIKEIHEAPNRSQPKFIEFYDVRAAEDALRALDGTDIAGRQIKLEPSLLEGPKSPSQQIPPKIEQDECGVHMKHSNSLKNANYGTPGAVSHGTIISGGIDSGPVQGLQSHTEARFQKSAFHHGISSSFSSRLSFPVRTESAVNKTALAEAGHAHGQLKFDIQGSPNFHPHSLPDYYDCLNNAVFRSPSNMAANMSPKPHEIVDNRQLHMISSNGNSIEFDGGFRSAASGGSSLPAHHYSWGNSYPTHPSGIMWPNSPSSVNGMSMPHPTARIRGPPRTPPPVLNSVLPVTNHHVGSAPTANPSLWQRRHAFAGESPETGFHPGSLGSLRISNSVHSMDFLSPNMYPRVAGSYLDLPTPPRNVGLLSHHQRSPVFTGRNQMIPLINSFDSPNERARSRRNEGSMNQTDKKLYELDIDRILQGQDSRTTLMLKNIPNKYTSKMLLAAIDERHKGAYDFLYLPIDFKNKCNVGYAFINMINPSYIIPFYQAFNGKKWEKFNSEKVASLAYARIQGKTALIAHFQNSSLMNEDKRCRPILFNTVGPNAGDQVPFPMGVNVRTRPGKPTSITHEETHLGGCTPGLANKEVSSNGDTSSGTGKESD